MLIPESQVKIWLYAPPTDMRKSFDGLSALVRTQLAEDPLSGQLFVFINCRRTQLKVLYFDRGGYCIWGKRLEQGQFHPHGDGDSCRLAWTAVRAQVEAAAYRQQRTITIKRIARQSGRPPNSLGHPALWVWYRGVGSK